VNRNIAKLALAFGTAALTACSFAPHYQKPATPALPAYAENAGWKLAQPNEEIPRGAWWTLFGDPQLNALEERVTAANQDLRAAFARLEQARQETRVARADYFPTLTAGSSLVHGRASATGPNVTPGQELVYTDQTLSADLSYEIDVWGRVRNTVAAAKATAQASAADLATLDLSTHAELATDYFTLRGDDTQQTLLDNTVGAYTRALQLTNNLYNGGAAAQNDVAQAQAQLEMARTQAEDIRLQRAQQEHAIAVLIGEPASSFHIVAIPLSAAPPAIAPGLPSALLERRPDIAAAERRVAAANARIGVARAAYFPTFSLSASAGFESIKGNNWISAPNRTWSLGPSAMLTLFDAGRNRALSAEARAAYEENVADYRGTVLNAYREVEDNLGALRQLQMESDSEAAAVTAAQTALRQANFRYQGGMSTYLEVVVAENTALQAQVAAVNIQTRRITASVLLVKALGGGWTGA
jgi:NodT family efflux transporter outer membrane factor (OMF) lipoprotein